MRKFLGIEAALRDRLIAGLFDETGELGVGHLMTVDPEARDLHRMRGLLLGALVVGPHGETPAFDPDHARRRPFALRQAAVCLTEALRRLAGARGSGIEGQTRQ